MKTLKIYSGLALLTLILMACPGISAPAPYPGDLDGDGRVTIRDAVVALRMAIGIAKPDQLQIAVGDLFPQPGTEKRLIGDGQITPGDARQILYQALGFTLFQAGPRLSVSTFAGSGNPGFDDRPGIRARFSGPTAVAVDSTGIIYVADRNNRRIRRIEPDGTVVTFAGSGQAGTADGPPEAAQFTAPMGIAVAPNGDIYVSDNHRIRRIAPDGTVTTIAGSTPGFADGSGTNARFNDPRGLAVDNLGFIYVADWGNNRVRVVSPSGDVRTLAGATATSILFAPSDVAVDAFGNVYVVDSGNHRIRKITPDGIIVTLAGQPTPGFADGQAFDAQFNSPQGIALDASGNLWVADTGNNRIRRVTQTGEVTTVAGQATAGFLDGLGPNALFNYPTGIKVDNLGRLIVADQANHRIRRLTPQ